METSFLKLSHRNERPCELQDVPNIVEYNRRATRKVELYGADADDCIVLRISDAYLIETSSRIRSELRSKRSYVGRSTRIEKPASGVLRRKQNFRFGRALHIEDVPIILRSTSNYAT
jgi:hypothetical protein